MGSKKVLWLLAMAAVAVFFVVKFAYEEGKADGRRDAQIGEVAAADQAAQGTSKDPTPTQEEETGTKGKGVPGALSAAMVSAQLLYTLERTCESLSTATANPPPTVGEPQSIGLKVGKDGELVVTSVARLAQTAVILTPHICWTLYGSFKARSSLEP